MEIKLFKHKNIISLLGIINYRRFCFNFRKICIDHQLNDAISKIQALIKRYGLLHLEYKTTDGYYLFILIDAWNKTKIEA